MTMMTTMLVAGFLHVPTFVNIHEMYIVKTSWLLAVSFSTELIGDLGAVRLFGNQCCLTYTRMSRNLGESRFVIIWPRKFGRKKIGLSMLLIFGAQYPYNVKFKTSETILTGNAL